MGSRPGPGDSDRTLNGRNTVDIGVVSTSLTVARKPVLFIERQAISLDALPLGVVLPVQHFCDIDSRELQSPFPLQQVDNFIRNSH
jgi:hypothetical protein